MKLNHKKCGFEMVNIIIPALCLVILPEEFSCSTTIMNLSFRLSPIGPSKLEKRLSMIINNIINTVLERKLIAFRLPKLYRL